MCADGRCRCYGKNWACPPACGSLDVIRNKLASYDSGVLVQTCAELDGDFDLHGVDAAMKRHKAQFAVLARQFRLLRPDCLPLTAGSCTLCHRCTFPERPCRFPEKRLSSMEAYGLLVSEVCEDAGLPYYNGPGTITFSSCILMKEGIPS